MLSKKNYIDVYNTTLVNKLNDAVIGKDVDDLLIVNSETIFTGTLTANGGLVGAGGGGGSGIVNNRIDGDLTIGEDTSDLLTITSKLNIPRGESGQVLTKQTNGTTDFSYIDNYDGCTLLDTKTITLNTNNILLDATSNYADFEYFEIVCTNIYGTVNGYIGWQPYDTSAITTSTDTKWTSTVITNNTSDADTNETKEWHILGFHTKGKQHIKAQIYNLNKTEKKYSFFNNVGLHSTTTNTISQNGSSSQNNTTVCRYLRLNNFSTSDTGAASGHITNAKILLYGYKPSGTVQTGTTIPTPTPSNSGKFLQVNTAGNGLEYAPNNTTFNNYMSGMEVIETKTETSLTAGAWEFTIPNINNYTHFKIVGLNINCEVDGNFSWAAKKTNGSINTVHSEYSYIYSKIGSNDIGRGSGENPNVNGRHLIAESTPGPINFEVTIYGIHKSEQKYSTFITTCQTSITEYDQNTSYYMNGSTFQYGADSDDDHICDKIIFYNYDGSNISKQFYGTIMLYGFKINNEISGNLNLAELTLVNNSLNNKITLKTSNSLTGDYSLTLPVDNGAPNQVLKTDGNGVLFWG